MKKQYIKKSVETCKLDLSNQFLAESDFGVLGSTTGEGDGFTELSKDYKGLDVWDEFED